MQSQRAGPATSNIGTGGTWGERLPENGEVG
jgi:hypothetical protein